MIPIVQPTLHDFDQVVVKFRQAWESGQITTGIFTRQLEEVVAEKLGVPFVVMVQSCTAGLMLVLRALELKGEIIMPAFTWTATAHAAVWNGLTPVFADVSPDSYTLDLLEVKKNLSTDTTAIVPVNIFGCPPDYEAFAQLAQETGLHLVYDSAQGLGSRFKMQTGEWCYSGNFGDAEVFSLSPTKVISAIEGGLITTNNRALAEKLRQMRDYGKSADGSDIFWLGLSARVPEINAIVGRNNFEHIDEMITQRRELIACYRNQLRDIPGMKFQAIPANCESTGNYFTIFINSRQAIYSRDEVYERLRSQGIQTKKYFYPALHLQKVYRQWAKAYEGKLPVTEEAANSGLALPLFTHMSRKTVMEVTNAIQDILLAPKVARKRRSKTEPKGRFVLWGQ
jgi:dTDP-4-amino-4,6-dideoxygalactose transaminase